MTVLCKIKANKLPLCARRSVLSPPSAPVNRGSAVHSVVGVRLSGRHYCFPAKPRYTQNRDFCVNFSSELSTKLRSLVREKCGKVCEKLIPARKNIRTRLRSTNKAIKCKKQNPHEAEFFSVLFFHFFVVFCASCFFHFVQFAAFV